MKIETKANYLFGNQRTSLTATSSGSSGKFAAALTSAVTGTTSPDMASAKQVDFTSMTRKEMLDWINAKIKNNEMSLDDSSAFLGMTVKIPPDSRHNSFITIDDRERVNFLELAQDGIVGAMSRNDLDAVRMLQVAIKLMQK